MGQLLNLIWDICCLRRGPQDLPYSPPLLAALVAANFAYQLLVATLRGLPFAEVLFGALFFMLMLLTALNVALLLRGLRSRFVQAATALLGCMLLFHVLRLPLDLLVDAPPATPAQLTPLQGLLALIALPLLGWSVVAYAHVLRHSLNISFLAGMTLSLLWIMILIALITVGTPAGT